MIKRHLIILFITLGLFIIGSCSSNKYAATNKSYKKQAKAFAKYIQKNPIKDSFATASQWVGTTNFGMRKPNFVIIHHTAQNSCEQTLKTFTLPRTQVSAHYVICKDGQVYHMLNDYLRAWHAGNSRWGNLTDINSSSIGIEIDNNGFDTFSDKQINSLLNLLGLLKKAHGIPVANFIGHGDIAPSRKVDPNVTFPWQKLSEQGYGLWYDDTSKISTPPNFSSLQALRIIGYDIRDSAAAIGAFKRHFLKEDNNKILTDTDRKILFNLSKKYQ